MTDSQKVEKIKALTGETDEVLLNTFLDIAGGKIINKAFPYRPYVTKVPSKYETVQIEIAVFLLNKRGAEGETYHSENGINRSYESASIPDSMLSDITPFVSVL